MYSLYVLRVFRNRFVYEQLKPLLQPSSTSLCDRDCSESQYDALRLHVSTAFISGAIVPIQHLKNISILAYTKIGVGVMFENKLACIRSVIIS